MSLSPRQLLPVRWGLGLVVLGLSVWAMVWLGRVVYVDTIFHQLPDLPVSEDDNIAYLSTYAIGLNDLLNIDPANGLARKRYATVLARQKEFGRASSQLDTAMQTTFTPDSIFFLGDMQDKMGHNAEALGWMRKALVLNPSDPNYNDTYLRLLSGMVRDLILQGATKGLSTSEKADLDTLQARFVAATRNWAIRAPQDKNSYLFMGNAYVGPPLYALQAYRWFLMGLSQSPWMNLSDKSMMSVRDAVSPILQIIRGRYAKPYRGIDFGAQPNAGR